MTQVDQRLKDTYKRKLWVFIAINVAFFWGIWVTGVFYGTEVKKMMSILLSPEAVFLPLVPVITTALSGVLPQSVKESIVFFRIHYRLPGCRAFSVWAHRDARIDPVVLRSKYGELPNEPMAQNRLWYSIYKSLENETVVIASHRDFLMLRDFAAIAFIVLVLGGSGILFSQANKQVKLVYAGLLFFQTIMLQISARNHGVRLVTNVLAIETQKARIK